MDCWCGCGRSAPSRLPHSSKLCAAAREHGNGVIEVTTRGSIQVRGLSAQSAPLFADAVARLGIATADGVPVLSNPLAGLDSAEILDAAALAADLSDALAGNFAGEQTRPKSLRRHRQRRAPSRWHCRRHPSRAGRAPGGPVLHVGIGGDSVSATELGAVRPTTVWKVPCGCLM